MHELAICQAMLGQVQQIARQNKADSVERITVKVGRLSGVEPPLLERAFEVARAGTIASRAELNIQTGPAIVKCGQCGGGGEVPANRLLCPECGDWRVRLTHGEEMTLMRLELTGLPGENYV